jgi:uncharacterized membrane protein
VSGDTPPPAAGESSASAYSRDRLVALSDGVIAIAITLLVLDVVPHFAATTSGLQLVQQLLGMVPELAAYLLSFIVIGRFWDYHRVFFGSIYRADSEVVWANLIVLLWITLIPATAHLLGTHFHEPAAVALYAVNLLLVIASLWMLWRVASAAACVRRDAGHERAQAYINRFVAVSLVGYTLAIPLALLSPAAALILVFLTTTLARVIARKILIPALAAA